MSAESAPKKTRRTRGTGSVFFHEGRKRWVARKVVKGVKLERWGETQGEAIGKLAAALPDPETVLAVELMAILRTTRAKRVAPVKHGIADGAYPLCDTGWVYFVRAGGKVKIGHAGNVRVRVSGLQTGCPEPLTCYGAVRGTQRHETLAHTILTQCRSHGEWFHFDGAKSVIDRWLESETIC